MTIEDAVALAEARLRVKNGELGRIRQQAKIPQESIAGAVGVTRTTVSRWESGQRAPSGEPAVRLARLLRELEKVTRLTAA